MFFKTRGDQETLERVKSYKKAFASPEGKQVLLDLMNRYHVLNSHQGDPFAEGQRSVVLEIIHQMNINLDDFNAILRGEFE